MVSIESLKKKIISLEGALNRKMLIIERQSEAIRAFAKEREPINNDERDGLYSQIDHLHRSLVEQSRIIDMYQEWFKKNQHWTQIHNSIMQYNPLLGQYSLEDGDVEIVVPEEEPWEVVKLSPVANDSEQE